MPSQFTTTYFRSKLWAIAYLGLAIPVFFPGCSLRGQTSASVLQYGAVADGVMRNDGAMVAGSAVLTSSSGSFVPGDVGKYIQVIGAGPGGTTHADGTMFYGSALLTSASGTFASSDVGRGMVVIGAGLAGSNLVTSIQNYSSPNSVTLSATAQTQVTAQPYYYGAMTLEGTIQNVQNSATVSLSASAGATISAAVYAYGTENHAAFQEAVDSTGEAGGGLVNVPAPGTCPSGATCGYVIKATDQMTANAPGAVKIRYNNVSLIGDAPQTNLFCRGAYSSYANSVAFPGVTGYIRGFCLTLGDNGGPNGTAGEAVSNVTISKLHLYGMTNGNTFNINFGYPPQSPTGDGWDITHKGIYMWDNSTFSNITIDSVVIQDFKAENIYSGGSTITGMVIENSSMTNFNGNGISMLAADLQVLNNTISNGSNAAVENSTVSTGSEALVSQLYQGNTISLLPREGIVVVGVDNGIASGTVQIVDNYFDTIAQTNPSGTESAIYIASQNNYVPPANVTVTGNTCHDCNSFGVFQTSGNTLIQGNVFTLDQHSAANVFGLTYALTGVTIANNTGSATANAQAKGLSVSSVYQINPGYSSGGFPWKNVVLKGNTWTFPGAPQYEFVTTSGLGWKLVTLDNLNWQGDVCGGCTHSDLNHGMVDLSQTTVIEPYGPSVYVTGNTSPVTATVDAGKQEGNSQVQIVNAGSNSVSFTTDSNLSLPGTVTLPGGSNTSATFVYSASLGKFTLPSSGSGAASVSPSGGTPQSTTVGTVFSSMLTVTVKDANNNPVSGVFVTFSTPTAGASASFGGLTGATVVTGTNGIATAPSLTANNITGSYAVTASVSGIATSATFSLTNTAATVAGGALTGSGNSSSATVNLTAEGTLDWEHWGESALNRKAGVSAQVGSYSVVGAGTVLSYSNDPRLVNWTDGTPMPSSSNNGEGVYISGLGQGFSFMAPADTTARTLVVHVGGWLSGGTLTATLSDGSAPTFADVTTPASGQFDRNYTLNYRAGTAGQTLIVNWTMTSGTSYGNVTLNAAALAGPALTGSSNINATGGTPQSTAVDTSFPVALQATVLDSGGSPVTGATVTFTAPTGGPGAAFGGSQISTATTNSNGIATASALTANNQTGTYVVAASVAGISTAASFSLTNTVDIAASIIATAGTSQSATLNTAFTTALQATVTDANSNPLAAVTVTFTAPGTGASATFAGSASATVVSNASGIATAPMLTANGQAGSYTLNATVAGVATAASFNLTNTSQVIVSGSGSLLGSSNSTNSPVNLTVEGTEDWIHWGDAGAPFNRKSGVTAQISNYTIVGSGLVLNINNDPRPISWTDGTPKASSTNDQEALYINNLNNGFSFTVPADMSTKTLTVYVGGFRSGGTLRAHLSDGSAADYVASTPTATGQYDCNYVLTYSAASSGQTLTITWLDTSGGGNVTLAGAALQYIS